MDLIVAFMMLRFGVTSGLISRDMCSGTFDNIMRYIDRGKYNELRVDWVLNVRV